MTFWLVRAIAFVFFFCVQGHHHAVDSISLNPLTFFSFFYSYRRLIESAVPPTSGVFPLPLAATLSQSMLNPPLCLTVGDKSIASIL